MPRHCIWIVGETQDLCIIALNDLPASSGLSPLFASPHPVYCQILFASCFSLGTCPLLFACSPTEFQASLIFSVFLKCSASSLNTSKLFLHFSQRDYKVQIWLSCSCYSPNVLIWFRNSVIDPCSLIPYLFAAAHWACFSPFLHFMYCLTSGLLPC